MSDNDARQPTDPAELERQIMNSNVPKNEREWWAQGKITALQERVAEVERQCRIRDSHYRQQHDANLANFKRAETAEADFAEALKVVRRLVSWCDEWRPGTPHPADDIAVARALIAKHGGSDGK